MIKKIIVVGIYLLINFSIFSQSFSLITPIDFIQKYQIIDSNKNIDLKAVFVQDRVNLFNENNEIITEYSIKKTDIVDIIGFSEQKQSRENDIENLSYIKIKTDNTTFWIDGSYPFIFDDLHPKLTFESQNINYNIYTAKNLSFFDIYENEYIGYQIVVIKNTKTNEYNLITLDVFPAELEGHSYKSEFLYLQNDYGVFEQISQVSTEKHLINLHIKTMYQEGKASYIITFPATSKNPIGNYWNIEVNK